MDLTDLLKDKRSVMGLYLYQNWFFPFFFFFFDREFYSTSVLQSCYGAERLFIKKPWSISANSCKFFSSTMQLHSSFPEKG